MELSDIYGYGQLFAFSGIDGETDAQDDFVGMLKERPIEIRLELKQPLSVFIPVSEKVKFSAVMNDFLQTEDCGKEISVVWADAATIIGKSDITVQILSDNYIRMQVGETSVYQYEGRFVGFAQKGSRFAVAYGRDATQVCQSVADGLNLDVSVVLQDRIAYYKSLPPCKDKKYEKLYYKALSVNKVNVFSAAGKIPVRYTTPDRIPHRHMWLWDSVFHAMALVQYDQGMAKDALLAVLSQQSENGFIPHMMSYYEYFDVLTQPPLLSYGVWIVYEACRDVEFLRKCAEKLDRYLRWDLENRDANNNYLLEWFIENDENCRSGESGMDNSPRFDSALTLDAIDFSSFFSNDAKYLSKIYAELGETQKAHEWNCLSQKVADAVNALLWCEDEGIYYDRKMDGTFSKVASVASFIPIFAEIPNAEKVARLVGTLTDEKKFWTEMPVSSLSRDNSDFCQDMWRGSTWLNYNYMIMCGLKKYGYSELAEDVRRKTLECVYRWYLDTGTIFEFYDSENKRPPYLLDRKGPCPRDPDWRKKVHAITDYNWSACFTILMIQNICY